MCGVHINRTCRLPKMKWVAKIWIMSVIFQRTWRFTNTREDNSHVAYRISLNHLYSLSSQTSYNQMSWVKAARLGVENMVLICYITGAPAALLPRHVSNFRAIRQLWTYPSRLRDLTTFDGLWKLEIFFRFERRTGSSAPDAILKYQSSLVNNCLCPALYHGASGHHAANVSP